MKRYISFKSNLSVLNNILHVEYNIAKDAHNMHSE